MYTKHLEVYMEDRHLKNSSRRMLGLQPPLEPKYNERVYMNIMIEQYRVLPPTKPPPGTIHTIYIIPICITIFYLLRDPMV